MDGEGYLWSIVDCGLLILGFAFFESEMSQYDSKWNFSLKASRQAEMYSIHNPQSKMPNMLIQTAARTLSMPDSRLIAHQANQSDTNYSA